MGLPASLAASSEAAFAFSTSSSAFSGVSPKAEQCGRCVQLLSVERIFVGILVDPNPAGLDDLEVSSDRRLKRLRERVDGVL